MFIKNVNIIYPDKIELGSVFIKEGKIEKINPSHLDYEKEEIIDGGGDYLAPGFIDIHIHGAGGSDTMEGTYSAINNISKTIAKHGTTGFLPTTMTCDKEAIKAAIEAIDDVMRKGTDGAEVLGIHMEGPFVNPLMPGAQDPQYIQEPSINNFDYIVGQYISRISSVTLAPERNGAKELVLYLTENGITVSAGHSKATYDEMLEAIKWGVSHSTHLFNAMSGLNHREPGLVGAIFDSDITTETICDGIHIAYPALRIALKQKTTDKMILVTDAMMGCGMPNGKYQLGGQDVFLKDGAARLENGALAGSVLTIDKAIKNLYTHTDYKLYEIVKMATLNPAIYCNVENRKGQIKEAYDADLVIFDKDINVKNVIIKGKLFHD